MSYSMRRSERPGTNNDWERSAKREAADVRDI